MATVSIVVKHQGKKYDVDVDTGATGETLKYQLFSLTGVEPDRQKILVKGGQLKDDADLGKLGFKPGQQVMMMGTASEGGTALERPKEPTKFVEDMTEAEIAQSEGATPAGLQNLGNTCYMNSTLQTLKAIPELQEQLQKYAPSNAGPSNLDLGQYGLGGLGASMDLTASLRDLYKQMSETQEGFPPLMFVNALRTAFPQFAQKAKDGHGYAQQDAEEAWSQIVSQLRQKLKIKEDDVEADTSFIDKYMAGRLESVMECDEAEAREAGEEPIKSEDTFFKLDCHISKDTNHLRNGIEDGLSEKIEKNSATLKYNATYTKTSRISRLPKYLPVHFVRFHWRRDIGKKTKIMRKVTFPHELDAVEFCTDETQKVLIPIRDKIREVRKDEEDIERARKRQKRMQNESGQQMEDMKESETKGKGPASKEKLAKEKASNVKSQESKGSKKTNGDKEMEGVEYKTDAQIEAEKAASLLKAKKELLALVDSERAKDKGANLTGLYELRGVITHAGASADSGHYTSYIKKEGLKDPNTGKRKEEDGKWWWFNDDKVSEVPSEKIESLSGGGESHSALILLYRAAELPTIEESEQTEEGKVSTSSS